MPDKNGRSGQNGKNGKHLERSAGPAPRISELGRRMREISDKALASGTKILSPDEIDALVSEIRGGH